MLGLTSRKNFKGHTKILKKWIHKEKHLLQKSYMQVNLKDQEGYEWNDVSLPKQFIENFSMTG